MKRGIVIALGILIFSLLGFFVFQKPNNKEISLNNQTVSPAVDQTVESKAGFAIFTNNTFRIFTDSKYHNLSEDVFIEASNPNIIHVKKQGLTWNDFFKTLPMKLEKDCLTTGTGQVFCSDANLSLKFYINNKEDKNALEKIINNGDRLLVTFGSILEPNLKDQLNTVPNP